MRSGGMTGLTGELVDELRVGEHRRVTLLLRLVDAVSRAREDTRDPALAASGRIGGRSGGAFAVG